MLMPDSAAVIPAARRDRLVWSTVGDDVIVFDQENARMHHLDAVCASVWSFCDGGHTLGEIASLATNGDEHTVRLALTRLEVAGLLVAPLPIGVAMDVGTRRRLLRNAAAAVALPAIVSITAPSAAMAATITCGLDDMYIADPTNCSRFYSCSEGQATLHTCPGGLHFNPSLEVCDWPADAGCIATNG